MTQIKKNIKKKLPHPISHYVCTGGCKQISHNPGKCTTSGCPRARNPLNECKCKNGKHGKLLYLNASRLPK